MKKYEDRIPHSRLVDTFIILICLGLLVLSLRSSGASSAQMKAFRSQERDAALEAKELRKKNQTQAFKVVRFDRVGQDVELTLRNEYDKNITAFAISPVDLRYGVRVDLIDSYEPIVPRATYVKRLTLPDSKATELSITVRCVVFQDGTSDGDIELTKAILDNRLGEKTQMQRIIALLDSTLKSPGANLSTAFDSLKARIKDLPIDSEQGASVYFRGGMHSAKGNAIRHLEKLELRHQQDGDNDLSQQLTEMRDNHERRIAKRRY